MGSSALVPLRPRAEDLPTLVKTLLDTVHFGGEHRALQQIDVHDAGREVIEWFRSPVRTHLERTHRHTNGFIKFVRVLPDYPRVQVRLHHWPVDGIHDWSSIHNHRADFVSVMLTGSLRERFYGVTYDGNGNGVDDGGHRLFDYSPYDWERGASERAMPSRAVRLHVASEAEHQPGDVRFLQADRLHDVLVSPLSTTLAVRGPLLRSHAQIAVPEGERPKLAPRLQELSPERVAEVLGTIADKFYGS